MVGGLLLSSQFSVLKFTNYYRVFSLPLKKAKIRLHIINIYSKKKKTTTQLGPDYTTAMATIITIFFSQRKLNK